MPRLEKHHHRGEEDPCWAKPNHGRDRENLFNVNSRLLPKAIRLFNPSFPAPSPRSNSNLAGTKTRQISPRLEMMPRRYHHRLQARSLRNHSRQTVNRRLHHLSKRLSVDQSKNSSKSVEEPRPRKKERLACRTHSLRSMSGWQMLPPRMGRMRSSERRQVNRLASLSARNVWRRLWAEVCLWPSKRIKRIVARRRTAVRTGLSRRNPRRRSCLRIKRPAPRREAVVRINQMLPIMVSPSRHVCIVLMNRRSL
jgi:hypothetical protein